MVLFRSYSRDFFGDEDIVSMSPLARLLFLATMMEADREGRLVWKPKTLKLRYLPGDTCDIDAIAGELITAGLIQTYDVDRVTYAFIPSFSKRQVINNREAASVLPDAAIDASATRDARDKHATSTRQSRVRTPAVVLECNGMEWNGSKPPSQGGDVNYEVEVDGETGEIHKLAGGGE